MKGKRGLALLAMGIVVAVGGGHAGASATASEIAVGTLNLRAELRLVSTLGACPPGVDAFACAARTGVGPVSGLGDISEAYTWIADVGPPSCPVGSGRTRSYPVRFTVAGKGEIHFALAEGAQCVEQEAVRTQTQAFTITGGTGAYSGASGGGIVERTLGGETATSRTGRETWTGTLDVPGLGFDVTPPTLSGASARRVRAPKRATRVRVTYNVTAQDGADGAVAVSCVPRSGSRFKIGRTVVTCSANDTSGNSRTATFTITVTRRR